MFKARMLRAAIAPVRSAPSFSRFVYFPLPFSSSDPSIAADIAAGHFVLGGRSLMAGNENPFALPSPGREFSVDLLSFEWLAHFDASEDPALRAHARMLVSLFLSIPARTDPSTMAIECAARRIHAFVTYGGLITEGSDHAQYQAVLHRMRRDAALLIPLMRFPGAGIERIFCATALLALALATDVHPREIERFEKHAARAFSGSVSEDGVPLSFSAAHGLRIASECVKILSLYRARSRKVPGWIESGIIRLSGFLRLMQHPDGSLARFSKSGHASRDGLADILDYVGARLPRLLHAAPSGFERLETDTGVLIADSGALPPKKAGQELGISALSFEYSHRGAPLIVNCGAPRDAEGPVEEAYRSAAAHSGIMIDEKGPTALRARILKSGQSALLAFGPSQHLPATRTHGDRGETLVIGHTGFQKETGYIVERNLTLLASKPGLMGLDRLIDVKHSSTPRLVTLSFHLDPDIDPQPLVRDDMVALALAARTGVPDLWIFEAPGQKLRIEESRFFSAKTSRTRTHRLVLDVEIIGNAEIQWRLVPFEG